MRKFLQPRFLLLLVTAAVVLYCILPCTPSMPEECTSSAPCAEEVPAKATELLWESFSHQFVAAIEGY